jgi:hypothetical protein
MHLKWDGESTKDFGKMMILSFKLEDTNIRCTIYY